MDTGRKFFKLFGSSEAFLRRANLEVDGKETDDKETLMMFISVGSRSSINSRMSDVGKGSSEQEVGFDFKSVAFSSASVIG